VKDLTQLVETLEANAARLKHSLKTSQETSAELRGMLHNMRVSRAEIEKKLVEAIMDRVG
jgi:hypothetical protein